MTKHEAYKDSLKQVEYNHIFPILGKGAYKKGFDIPYLSESWEISFGQNKVF